MALEPSRRRQVFDKTAGRCHICTKTLCFNNYGQYGARGAWHIDHSVPRSRGGSDHINNYLPACITCNLAKSNSDTRTARKWNGRTAAPMSKARQQKLRNNNATALGFIGGLLGLSGGPVGAALGAAIGAAIGHNIDPQN